MRLKNTIFGTGRNGPPVPGGNYEQRQNPDCNIIPDGGPSNNLHMGGVEMKTARYMATYLIALTMSLGFMYALSTGKTGCKCESILPRLELACTTLQGHINIMQDNKVLLDQIDLLTRENVVLRQEVADQYRQLREFDEMVKGEE